jgi:threonine dehydrogenase-like Zn-dependent dehydrogenase
MRALVYDGALRLGQLPRPVPSEGEVLVRVRNCAISRSDLDMVQGRRPVQVRPVILGHQFVGDVVDGTGPLAQAWIGKRVVAQPHRGCGGCASCRRGMSWLCINGRARSIGMGLIDGAFAEWVTVPVGSLIHVPDAVDDDDAVFAHPVASALVAMRQVQGSPPQRVLVVGDGNMGLLITLILHAVGHTVSVFGRHPSRRDLLWRSGISFTGVQESRMGDSTLLEQSFARESFGTVFECSGRPSGFDLALQAVRPRGRLVLVSYHPGEPGFDLRALADREIEVVGISGGPLSDALEYLSSSKLDTLPLVTARLPLPDGVDAFQQAARRGTLRVILHNTFVDGAES